MADKKKAGVSVVPEFVAGEQPTADKFNAIGVQLERAASELEKAVGDVWGESWPYTDSDPTRMNLPTGRKMNDYGAVSGVDSGDGADGAFLDIANIGRLIGPSSNLNPHILTNFGSHDSPIFEVEIKNEKLDTTFNGYTDGTMVGLAFGIRQYQLRYRPSDTAALTFSGAGATVFMTRKSNHAGVENIGDWHCDNTGLLTSKDRLNGDTVYVTYKTKPVQWGTGSGVQGSTFNVIPDPNQIFNGGSGCTATLFGDSYIVSLPVATYGKMNEPETGVDLDEMDINYNKQLRLPVVLQENFSTGDTIPEGFLYIRDNATNKIYNDAIYIYNNSTQIEVKNVTLDTTSSFSIITIGSTITGAIQDLRWKANHHRHDGTYGEPPIHIKDIIGIHSAGGYTENDVDIVVHSKHRGNWMPQYLSRSGYIAADSKLNDGNAMRGDLVMGRYNKAAGDSVNKSDSSSALTGEDSFCILFGGRPDTADPVAEHNKYAPAIYMKQGCLTVQGSGGYSVSDIRGPGSLNLHGLGNLTIEAGSSKWKDTAEFYHSDSHPSGSATSHLRLSSTGTIYSSARTSYKARALEGSMDLRSASSAELRSLGGHAKLTSDIGVAKVSAGTQAQIFANNAIFVKSTSGKVELESGNGKHIVMKCGDPGTNGMVQIVSSDDIGEDYFQGLSIAPEESTLYAGTSFQVRYARHSKSLAVLDDRTSWDAEESQQSGSILRLHSNKATNNVGYSRVVWANFTCEGGESQDPGDWWGGEAEGEFTHNSSVGMIASYPRTASWAGGESVTGQFSMIWSLSAEGSGGGAMLDGVGSPGAGRAYNGAVVYISGGNDFGEYFIPGDVEEWNEPTHAIWKYNENNRIDNTLDRHTMGLPESTVVYVRDGKFWKNGPGLARFVTQSAMVAGNGLPDIMNQAYEILSFIGQLDCLVQGTVKQGDYILPGPDNMAIAIDPDEITFSEYRKVMGTVIDEPELWIQDPHISVCLVAVGVK